LIDVGFQTVRTKLSVFPELLPRMSQSVLDSAVVRTNFSYLYPALSCVPQELNLSRVRASLFTFHMGSI